MSIMLYGCDVQLITTTNNIAVLSEKIFSENKVWYAAKNYSTKLYLLWEKKK